MTSPSETTIDQLCSDFLAITKKYDYSPRERATMEHMWAMFEDVVLDRELETAR